MGLNIDEIFRLQLMLAQKPMTGRDVPLKKALIHIYDRFGFQPINIVETGTIRVNANNYMMGDGWATLTWLLWVFHTKSKMWTVDINPEHMKVCQQVTAQHKEYINYVVSDSVKFLKEFDQTIHMLYLDSYDWDASEECKNHQLNEVKAAMDKLHPDALILTDDNPQDQHGIWKIGKGVYMIPYLLENGFEIIFHEDSQVLLSRKKS